MKNSQIQWCNHTFNPWEGCAKVAPECKYCYAETLVDHRFGRVKWGKGQPRRRMSDAMWEQPLRWNEESKKVGKWAKVFCLSLGDWLDEEVPVAWLVDLLALIRATPNLDWLLLTKRPQNWRSRLELAAHICGDKFNGPDPFSPAAEWLLGDAPLNVWIGVSAGADQRTALDIPACVHFLSCEPMLKPLDQTFLPTQEFDWIIFGGESGKNARPCHIQWIRDGLAFCRRNNISPFVKQLGFRPVFERTSDAEPLRKLKDSHGGDMSEWPEDLRVREFPTLIPMEAATCDAS